MSLPQINNSNVSSYLSREEVVRETAAQIMKDFGMFGVEINFSGNTEEAYQELHDQLTSQITGLISTNYDLLLSILYQVDISNKDLHRAHEELPKYTHVEVVAHEIIVRDLKKVLLRRYFKMKDGAGNNGKKDNF